MIYLAVKTQQIFEHEELKQCSTLFLMQPAYCCMRTAASTISGSDAYEVLTADELFMTYFRNTKHRLTAFNYRRLLPLRELILSTI
jgi:hypothetical protein